MIPEDALSTRDLTADLPADPFGAPLSFAEALGMPTPQQAEQMAESVGTEDLRFTKADFEAAGIQFATGMAMKETPDGEMSWQKTDPFAEMMRLVPRMTPDALRSLAWAPEKQQVNVMESAEGFETRTMGEVVANRSFVQKKGGLEIGNDYVAIRSDSPLKGHGHEMFADQVATAQDLGFDRITTEASGAKDADKNGYYTWPRLGYDGPLKKSHLKGMPEDLRAALPEKPTIQDLFAAEGGRDWWKENGSTVSLGFDLTPGSRSEQALHAYGMSREVGQSLAANPFEMPAPGEAPDAAGGPTRSPFAELTHDLLGTSPGEIPGAALAPFGGGDPLPSDAAELLGIEPRRDAEAMGGESKVEALLERLIDSVDSLKEAMAAGPETTVAHAGGVEERRSGGGDGPLSDSRPLPSAGWEAQERMLSAWRQR